MFLEIKLFKSVGGSMVAKVQKYVSEDDAKRIFDLVCDEIKKIEEEEFNAK